MTAKDVRDSIQGANVVFIADGGGTNTATPTSATTNASGVATSTYTGTAAGAHTIGAQISTITIAQTATV